jgi:hypothetical protein
MVREVTRIVHHARLYSKVSESAECVWWASRRIVNSHWRRVTITKAIDMQIERTCGGHLFTRFPYDGAMAGWEWAHAAAVVNIRCVIGGRWFRVESEVEQGTGQPVAPIEMPVNGCN